MNEDYLEEIRGIYEEALKIVDSDSLSVETKKRALEYKIARTKRLVEKRLELGWVDVSTNNLAVLEIENLKDGLIESESNISETKKDNKTEKPPLFERPKSKKSRYYEHSKLEELFREVAYASYMNIALKIGTIKKESYYDKAIKDHILEIKNTFNKYSETPWRERLVATKRKRTDGLKLVAIN